MDYKPMVVKVMVTTGRFTVTANSDPDALAVVDTIMQDTNVVFSRATGNSVQAVIVNDGQTSLNDVRNYLTGLPGVSGVVLDQQVEDPFLCLPQVPILPAVAYPIPCAIAGCGLTCCSN